MMLSEPSPAQIDEIVNKYARARSFTYVEPPQLLQELVRDVNEVAFPYMEYLRMQASDLGKDLLAATSKYIAADKAGIQAREDLKRTDPMVRDISREIASLTDQIDASRSSPAKLAELSKKLALRRAELDLVERKLNEYDAIFQRSAERLDSLKPILREVGEHLSRIDGQFTKGRHLRVLAQLVRFTAFILPVALAFVITLVFDRFDERIETWMRTWLPGNHHDAVLLALFAGQILWLSPVISAVSQPFWEHRTDWVLERFRTLSADLGSVNLRLVEVDAQIKAILSAKGL